MPAFMANPELLIGNTFYTAVFGHYDKLREPKTKDSYVCFTDSPIEANGWNIVQYTTKAKDKRLEARRHKILSHMFFKGDITIWVDANFEINIPFDEAVEKYLGRDDIALHRHHERRSIYEEVDACIKYGRAPKVMLDIQRNSYLEACYEDQGLFETGVIIRRNTQRIRDLNTMWFGEIVKFTNRDQISLPYCLWMTGIKPRIIPGSLWESKEFVYTKHTNPDYVWS